MDKRHELHSPHVDIMKISARNVLKGTIKSIKYGQILAELVIELPGGTQITSLITRTSAEQMQLAEGKEISAVIKASNVMVALE
ncbi:MAG: molybdopterin-binding protein [Methanomicrobiaceae archaeon]|nr:molybdopterin-binding protein [Methanomicrobiaceae archaeon]